MVRFSVRQFRSPWAAGLIILATVVGLTPRVANGAHERWKIKTTVSASMLNHPKAINLSDLKQLRSFDHLSTSEFDAKLIKDSPPGSNLHEGDVMRTTGWLHLIAWEHGSSGDGDFHMQLSTSRTDGRNCVIMEVPDPDAEDVPSSLQPRFRTLRQTLEAKVLHGHSWGRSGN